MRATTKVCSRCRVEKPISEFYRNRRSKDGRNSYCRTCMETYRSRPQHKRAEYEGATRKRRARVQFWMDHPTLSTQECADRLGITYSSLVWSISQEDSAREKRIERRNAAAELRAQAEFDERLRTAKPCLVCGEPVLRGPNFTCCSPECTDLWGKGRLHLSEEEHHKHRISVARGILKNPGKYRDVQVEWAKRMLSANPPPPNRRYEIPLSESSLAAAEAKDRLRRGIPEPSSDDEPFIDWTQVAS